jgi:hypothetical protein
MMWLTHLAIGHEVWLHAIETMVTVVTTGIWGVLVSVLWDLVGVWREKHSALLRAQIAEFNAQIAKFEAQIAEYRARGAESLERERLARKRIARIRR